MLFRSRAVELGDCWTPFVAEPEDVARGDARARELGGEIEIAAPLGRVADDDPTDRANAFVNAGAAYLKCGFRGRTPEEWLANLERFSGRFQLST